MSNTLPFHNNLRILRTLKKRSQEVVAESVGVKRSSYSGYENGTVEPSMGTIVALGQYHRLALDILLTTDLSTLRPSQVEEMQRGY